MRQGSFPRHYAELLISACVSRGHCEQKLLADAGIDSADWAAGSDLTPLQFGRIYQQTLWLVGDESFGLLGEGVPNGSFRMLCLSVLYCESFGKALVRAAEFMEVAIGYAFKPTCRLQGESAWVEMSPLRVAPDPTQYSLSASQAPHTLLIWINLISWFMGQALPVSRVRLRVADKNRHLHQSFFDCAVEYGSRVDAFECPASALQWPFIRDEMELSVFLSDAMPTLLSPRKAATSWHNRVLALMAQNGSHKFPTSVDIARHLHVSQATLRRRLSAEGTSLKTIKDEFRCGAAMRYLSSTGLPLKEIAARCGYDNPSDFNRAFRRWSGQTPGHYRKSLPANSRD